MDRPVVLLVGRTSVRDTAKESREVKRHEIIRHLSIFVATVFTLLSKRLFVKRLEPN